jgi:hypothetical protein
VNREELCIQNKGTEPVLFKNPCGFGVKEHLNPALADFSFLKAEA